MASALRSAVRVVAQTGFRLSCQRPALGVMCSRALSNKPNPSKSPVRRATIAGYPCGRHTLRLCPTALSFLYATYL